ncbi:hypothetical protein MLD38_012679 [Melastoma candidum]|uniref:Uncharacterized protein n=1 Tax=Melastoma candidum TaxID=119954 RepID=A0ACB9R6I7_9MYRT|nr:hypothetical protein MLD38_012679 [Melastoma candidum]
MIVSMLCCRRSLVTYVLCSYATAARCKRRKHKLQSSSTTLGLHLLSGHRLLVLYPGVTYVGLHVICKT